MKISTVVCNSNRRSDWKGFNVPAGDVNTYFQVVIFTVSRENDIEECGLELFFNADFEILGKLEHHELKEDGDSIQVTEENKLEYIE